MIETILIANTAEAFEGLLLKTSDTLEGKFRMRHELALSQRAFFWESDNKAVITPYLIPIELLEHNKRQYGFSNSVNWSPKILDGVNLSKMILGDQAIKKLIAKAAKDNPSLIISPYAYTADFQELLADLKKLGIKFQVPEQPLPESHWTTNYLDSKDGFRAEMLKLAGQHPNLNLPEGFVAKDKKETIEICYWFWKRNKSFVLKANYGESGWGLLIINRQKYPSFQSLENKLNHIFSIDPVWDNTLIIVEEFIKPDMEVAGGSPSTEVLLNGGGYQITYHCGQLLDASGGFLGVEIGKRALQTRLEKRLVSASEPIAQRYWELGYRGFFDIDFVVSKTNILYLMETNTRRTGGTHVYDLACFMFGESWQKDAYFLSHDSFSYGQKVAQPEILLEKISAFIYPMDNQRKGIVVTLLSPEDPIMGYVVIAHNAKEGRQLQQDMFRVFNL